MRLLICAGGTGGGVYPALAVLQALTLSNEQEKFDVKGSTLWVGGIGGMEADLVKRLGIPFEPIPAAGVHGVGLRALPGNLVQIGRGYKASRRLLRAFRPDVLLFTGGYVAVPMAVAGRVPLPGMARPHSLLYIPDIEPGVALKTLARFSDHIAVTSEETRQYLPGHSRVTVTGYPVRKGLKSWTEEEARKILGIRADLPVLLVTGGSKGAHSINSATLAALPELLAEMQVIHISGKLDWPEVEKARQTLTSSAGITQEQVNRYHPYPYLHEEMGAALMVADLVLSRGGASTLGEYPQFSLPAVLVPYPHAWRYQWVNARYLADKGAAVVIQDADLPTKLAPVVRDLMANPQRRNEMREAMQALSTPRAAETIAAVLWDLAKPETHQRT